MDKQRVEEFAGRLFGFYTGALLSDLIAIGHRTGLFEAAAQGPATSAELATRAGLQERYVREWLGAMATSGVLDYAAATAAFTLPAEHAVCLTGPGSANLAPFSEATTLLGQHVDGVERAFREGGGVPYEEFRPRFTAVMDGLSRGVFDEQLLTAILPVTGELPRRLEQGVRAAEIGCGTGHALTLLARAFPASEFTGFDLAADAIEQGRAEAADQGLTNVSFEVLDVAELPADPVFTAVFAFDTIHDQATPAAVLRRVHEVLEPGGWFVMMDTKAATDLEANLQNPFAPLLYSISTLHCMTVSLARRGAGLGTVWGEQLAKTMLADAGFGAVDVHDVPDDPLDAVYVTRKPA